LKITLLPSSAGPSAGDLQYLTTFLIDDTIAIDAGSLGFVGTPAEQRRIQHVFLSHSHIDHVASLPIFLENVYVEQGRGVTVYAGDAVLQSLHADMFNDRVWPDFFRLSAPGHQFVRSATLTPLTPVSVGHLRVTAVPVNHLVPTMGFIVEDGQSAVVFSADTGPTEEIWRWANALPNLRAVFLEVTFPNNMSDLAELTKHLTPEAFAAEVRKVSRAVPFLAFHLKPRFAAEVGKELQDLRLPNLQIAQSGVPYTF
jgi:ribonuclease BN (tRNA processing enzyme)